MLCMFVSARHSWVKQTFWKVKKIPSASFRKNTVQSSSILNRIKFITAYPRQYKRKRSQYFDTFSQLSLCNCKADIYEAGSLSAAWFLYCIPRSPALDLALRTCVHLHCLNSLHKKDQITSLHLPKEGYGLNYVFFFIESHLPEAFRDSLRRVQKLMCAEVAPGLLCGPSRLPAISFWAAVLLSLGKVQRGVALQIVEEEEKQHKSVTLALFFFNDRFFSIQLFWHVYLKNWLKNIWVESLFSLCCYCSL